MRPAIALLVVVRQQLRGRLTLRARYWAWLSLHQRAGVQQHRQIAALNSGSSLASSGASAYWRHWAAARGRERVAVSATAHRRAPGAELIDAVLRVVIGHERVGIVIAA